MLIGSEKSHRNAAKIARVAYGVVKNGTEYQPFFKQRLPSGSIPLTRAVEALATS
jgi:hypothetical protein